MPPAILVEADTRDIRLYEGLVTRGYRLLGFPERNAAAVQSQGVPIVPVDLEERAEPRAQWWAEQVMESIWTDVAAALAEPGFAEFLQLDDPRTAGAVRGMLEWRLRPQLKKAVVAVEAFQSIADREDLRLVIVREDPAHPGKAVVRAAQQRGIPTLYLMHAISFGRLARTDIFADRVAMFGEFMREWYGQFSVPVEKMAITGNPVWDGYREAVRLIDPRDIKTSLGFDPQRPLVLYASTVNPYLRAADFVYWDWPWQHYEAAMQALAEVHQRRPLQVVVKLHPADQAPGTVKRHQQVARATGVPSLVLAGGHADPRHVLAADLVICVESNIAIEAMLLDRPAMTLQLGGLFQDYLFSDEDGVLIARRPEQIAPAIEAALFDPQVQASLAQRRPYSLYRFGYLNDGRAFDRVLQLIDMMLDPGAAQRRLEQGAPVPLVASPTSEQRWNIGRQHLLQAQRELDDGRLEAAEYLVERALPYLGEIGAVHLLRGGIALRRAQPEAALAAFEAAVTAEPNNPAFHNALASALYEMGRVAEAEAALRRALALDGSYVEALSNLGELLLELGCRQEAVTHLERASVLAPHDQHVRRLLARARAS